MRYACGFLMLAMLLTSSVVRGQGPVEPKTSKLGAEATSLGHITPTPEMWFYDQELRQRYSPALAVRRKAEFETDQRMRRMAAREWYGYSALRPAANPNSMMAPSPVQHTIVPSTRPTYNVW